MTLVKCLAAALLVAVLGACASSAGGAAEPPASAAPRTASDQTDADRRAAVRMELAALYFGRGQYTTALDEIKLALAARPDMGPAYNLQGLVYSSMSEDRLAEESFSRALQIDTRDADAMHNFAWHYCQRSRYDEAQRLFEQALAQAQYRDPQRTMLAQGVCLAREGKLPEAEQRLVRAYELDPSNPTTALNLSEVLYRRGSYERARFYIQRVNAREDLSNAQTLWLALRIENRLGNRSGAADLGRQLRNRFPQSPEALAFEQGRVND